MKFAATALALAGLLAVRAQDNDNDNDNNNANQSICDKYTTAALKNNTAENQAALLTVLVNTVVIGNYSKLANGDMVPGILAPGKVNGEDVELLKYFNGSLLSTNGDNHGSPGKAVSVNFLDSGGPTPLMNDKAANDDDSNQATLLNHLYQVFGVLLGCSMQGGDAFPSYQGDPSMSRVHKYMNLNTAETTYFVQQVGAAAKSFGVSDDDISTVATALTNTFNKRCAPPMALASGAPNASQSICVAADCELAQNSDCTASSDISAPNGTDNVEPAVANKDDTDNAGGSSGGSGGSSGGMDGAFRTAVDTFAAIALAGGAVAAAAFL